MSSAIHNYLFAPMFPSSDSSTSRLSPLPNYQPATSSRLRSYLIPGSVPRSPDLEGQSIRTRSPRTPQNPTLETPLAVPEHHLYPSARERKQPTHRHTREDKKSDGLASPLNVPSKPIPREGFRPPRAVLRMVAMLVLMGLAAMVLLRTSAKMPNLPIGSMRTGDEAMSSGKTVAYQPTQTVAVEVNRAKVHHRPARTAHAYTPQPHPIPSSHELLALQSYLLQSDHNILPPNIDPLQPLDGNVILAISPSKLGQQGSALQKRWMDELEREREEDIVVWAPAGSHSEVEAIYTLIGGMTVDSRIPSYIELEGRSDKAVLGKILERLGVEVKTTPLVMLGNKAIRGGKKELVKMKDEGKLREELRRIGWLDDWKSREGAKEPGADEEDKAPAKAKGKKKGNQEGKKADEQAQEADNGEEEKRPRIMNAAFKAH